LWHYGRSLKVLLGNYYTFIVVCSINDVLRISSLLLLAAMWTEKIASGWPFYLKVYNALNRDQLQSLGYISGESSVVNVSYDNLIERNADVRNGWQLTFEFTTWYMTTDSI